MNIKSKLKKMMEEHIKTRFEWEEINLNTFRIITPFLDRRNDNIEIYLTYYDDDNIILSDKSYTILDLNSENINVNSYVENRILKGILLQHTVKRKDDELYKKSNLNKLGMRSINFIQCILKLNDLYLVDKWNTILNELIVQIENKKDNTTSVINQSIKINNLNITINTNVLIYNTKRSKVKEILKQSINSIDNKMTKNLLNKILENEKQSLKQEEINYINNFKKSSN